MMSSHIYLHVFTNCTSFMSAGLITIRTKNDAMQGEGSIYYATLQGYIIFDRSGETPSPARVSKRFTD